MGKGRVRNRYGTKTDLLDQIQAKILFKTNSLFLFKMKFLAFLTPQREAKEKFDQENIYLVKIFEVCWLAVRCDENVGWCSAAGSCSCSVSDSDSSRVTQPGIRLQQTIRPLARTMGKYLKISFNSICKLCGMALLMNTLLWDLHGPLHLQKPLF